MNRKHQNNQRSPDCGKLLSLPAPSQRIYILPAIECAVFAAHEVSSTVSFPLKTLQLSPGKRPSSIFPWSKPSCLSYIQIS